MGIPLALLAGCVISVVYSDEIAEFTGAADEGRAQINAIALPADWKMDSQGIQYVSSGITQHFESWNVSYRLPGTDADAAEETFATAVTVAGWDRRSHCPESPYSSSNGCWRKGEFILQASGADTDLVDKTKHVPVTFYVTVYRL